MHTATARACRAGAALALALATLAASHVAAAAAAAAADTPAPADLPVCRLDPHDSTKLAEEPCRPAPPVQPRRSVAQVIGRMPVQRPSSPVAVPPVAPLSPNSTSPTSPASPVSPLPQAIGSCDVGGCRDAAGARYNGAGNATLDANGRICHRNGAFVQCF